MILNVTSNSRVIQDTLRKLHIRLVETIPLMTNLGGIIQSSARKRIAITKQSPSGQAWKPLSQRTVSERIAKGRDPLDILRRTSALINSIQLGEVTANRVTVGSPLEYAGKHQLGDAANRIPARPFLGLDDDDKEVLELAAVQHLESAIR